MAEAGKGRSLEETPTWAVAVVCFVLVLVSIFIEHILHLIGKWFKRKHKRALFESLEKIKSELMLLGFISLLLTVGQGQISKICIPESVGATWHPCSKVDEESHRRKLLNTLLNYGGGGASGGSFRRVLAAAGTDKCAKGKVPLVSSDGIHQLHIFIFVLAVFHVLYCILTMVLGRAKMRSWKHWEKETRTAEYQFSHDPERFRFARETSFGRRHLNFWSKTPVLIWIVFVVPSLFVFMLDASVIMGFSIWWTFSQLVCFFRQFVRSVRKVDYLTLRHGFIMAHLAPQSHSKFDFQKYINRSLEEDFKVVVGISPPIWFFAVLFLLCNTHGWYSRLWLPFIIIPLMIILLVGTKLQVIITKMGLTIHEKGEVVKGVPVVQLGDDLFWFNRPRLILYLINFVLFQNAFQLAFFAWTWTWGEFGLKSCFPAHTEDVVIRISMGIIIQILCSYVTLPLYALVTQMGSTMKPTIFNERVATALKSWHHTAKKHVKESRHSGMNTPLSSRQATPTNGMSPIHLLRYHHQNEMASVQVSPRRSNFDTDQSDNEGSLSHSHHLQLDQGEGSSSQGHHYIDRPNENELEVHEPGSSQVVPIPQSSHEQHEIDINSPKAFSFDRRTSI